jgi:hypothetical protein
VKKCDDGKICTADSCDSKNGKCTTKPVPAAGAPVCDGTVYAGSCYKATKVELLWNVAQSACIKWGGNLVSIGSSAEQTQVTAIALKTCGNDKEDFAWIGLSDTAKHDTWVWVDGTPFVYKNWDKGEPSNTPPGEEKVQMHPGGKWNDQVAKAGSKCYICERLAAKLCDDGDACTSSDQCDKAGKCSGAKKCDDGKPCTLDQCDSKTGKCDFSKKVEGCCLQPGDCDDSDPCTDDKCTKNKCSNGAIANCCQFEAECDDANSCTTDECLNNQCSNQQKSSQCCQVDAECDDSDECTEDTCAGNSCDFSPKADGEPCSLGTCQQGTCQGGNP